MADGCSGGSCPTGSCTTGSCSTGSCSSDGVRLPQGMLEQYDLNNDARRGILAFIDTEGDALGDSAPGILTLARDASNDRVFAVIFGGVEMKDRFKTVFSYGVDTLYHMRNKDRSYHARSWAKAILDVVDRVSAATILFPDTRIGEELASICAAESDAGICVGCTGLRNENAATMADKNSESGTFTVMFAARPAVVVASSGGLPAPVSDAERKGTVINRPFALDASEK